MNRYSIIIAIMTAVLIALGVDTGLVVRNSEHLSHELGVVCTEHRTLARIAQEEAQEGVVNQGSITSRINIPGLTHGELIQLTEKKEVQKQRRAAELSLISRQTC